jgi:protein CpxP
MKIRFLKIATLALALILSAGAANAQDVAASPMHGGRAFGGAMFGFFGHQLDLTDAQKAQVKDIMAKERPTLKPLMQQLGQGLVQLHALELNGNFNEEQARTIAAQQSQTMTELAVQRARIETELIQVLTPDQKTKLAQMWQRREQRLGSQGQEAQ